MEPTDNLSFSGTTFDQEQEEDLMWSLFLLPEPQSPSPSSLLLSLPPAEGFAGPESFGDGQISPMDEETNYAVAPAAPLVATHGTGAGQLSYNLRLLSPTSDEFDHLPLCFPEEEVQHAMMSFQASLHPSMALDGLSNTTNGGSAAHADAVPPVVQQGTSTTAGTLIPAAPQDQEADVPSRALTRRRSIKSRGLPIRQQDWFGKLFDMGMDMLRQFGRHIGKMTKDEEDRSKVWQCFWRSYCDYCGTVTVICQYCYTVMRKPSIIELLSHLEYHLPLASSRVSNETQQSSHQALQIKEIAENPNGESEPIETENSNCATAARVDTQGTNAVVLSPWQQHQLPMDREELIETILSSHPSFHLHPLPRCKYTNCVCMEGSLKYFVLEETDSWCDLIIRLSDSSGCSSTTKSTHDGFRLKLSNKETGCQIAGKEMACKIVHVDWSATWEHVSENPCKDHAGVFLGTGSNSDTIGSSFLMLGVNFDDRKSAPAGFAYPWQHMYLVLRSLGLKEEFATNFVIYALGWLDACNLRLSSPRSSNNKGKSIVEQGDVSSGKRKRKSAPPRSKVWNHFTKVEVEAEGSTVTMAKCIHCGSELKAGSASHGTTHLARHIRSIHPDHGKSL